MLSRTTHAQTLYGNDVIPLVGDTFRYDGVELDDLFDPGPAGLGVTWDHSGLGISADPYTQYVSIDPLTAPGITQFPMSDVVIERIIGGTGFLDRFYYDQNWEGLLELGSIGDPLILEYDQPEQVQPVPMVYDSLYTAAYCFYSTGLGATYHTCGITESILDGEGTLMLPYGTFTDVKRTTLDRFYVEEGSPLDTSYVTVVRWWVPGLRRHVLELNRFTGSNGTTLSTVTLMQGSSALGIPSAPSGTIVAFPNPFRDQVCIPIDVAHGMEGVLDVFTPDGCAVLSGVVWPAHATSVLLPTENLPNGLLLLRLRWPDRTLTQGLVHAQ